MSEKKVKKVFVDGPISAQFIADSISKHSTKKEIGAHSIFLGQIRNDVIDNKEVAAIEYTSYEEMANEKFYEIREEAFSLYSLTCMHIYHSLGLVKTGEISLFVFTSSVHRDDAIKACEYIVNRIKKEAPVWGKEIFDNNEYIWKKSEV
jgi:molybdopterin synthase catalytic subunit